MVYNIIMLIVTIIGMVSAGYFYYKSCIRFSNACIRQYFENQQK